MQRKSNWWGFFISKSEYGKSQYDNLTSLIHLLNIANVIPFIASLGIHFTFINVIIYREIKTRHHCPIIGKEKDYMINIRDKLILMCECKFKVGVKNKNTWALRWTATVPKQIKVTPPISLVSVTASKLLSCPDSK